ncbi:peptidase T, partial [bacterium]|nr:peptidase T [bacterium]
EIGKGVNHLDLKELGAIAAYTLDGAGQGEIDGETFSADLATVTIHGRNIHPSIAKNRMTNAIRLAAIFIERLPKKTLTPETTEGMEGFLHPYTISGGVAEVTIKILLRDFNSTKLKDYESLLSQLASQIRLEYPESNFDIRITKQYRNMAEGMSKEPRAIPFAVEAMKLAGLQPKVTSVRGGTDDSQLINWGAQSPFPPGMDMFGRNGKSR